MKHIRNIISSAINNFYAIFREKQNRTFILLYFLLIFLSFLYSFTQVDLGLTITRNQFFFNIERLFQYVGYFNRTLSALLFIKLISLLFIFYGLFLHKIFQKKISLTHLTGILVFVTPLLALHYNAFSYDLFNYIFDAKIVTFYHLNPYMYKALDFPTDPMLSFMHWVHRVYPYGPIWLLFTVPLSFLGFQYFIPTLILFKLLAAVFFILTVVAIAKISDKIYPKTTGMSVAFFALSPLVLIESLISAHNDIVMMGLAMWAVFFLISKKYTWAFAFLLLSIGIKFATLFLFPLFCIVVIARIQGKDISWEKFFFFCFIAMVGAVFAASMRSTFQPWYLLYVFPFAALMVKRKAISIPVTIFSFVAIFNYLPYLYLGNWNEPIPFYLTIVNCASVILCMVIGIYFHHMKRNNQE